MKELLAMLLAFFTSLGTSTDFSIVADKPYTTDYYTVDITDPPDYRTFYDSSVSASSETNCKTTTYTAQGRRVASANFNSENDANIVGYWFANNQTFNTQVMASMCKEHISTDKVEGENKVDYYEAVGCFTEGTYIIMPYSGTLQSPSASTMNHSMTVFCANPVNGQQYKLKICNMRCWYCDVGRKGALDTTEPKGNMYHTSDEKPGKKIPAGAVLGVATKDTKIQIIPIDANGTSVGTATLTEFYEGTFTKPKK